MRFLPPTDFPLPTTPLLHARSLPPRRRLQHHGRSGQRPPRPRKAARSRGAARAPAARSWGWQRPLRTCGELSLLLLLLNLITQAISLKEKTGKEREEKITPALPFILRIMEFAPFLQRVNSLTKTT